MRAKALHMLMGSKAGLRRAAPPSLWAYCVKTSGFDSRPTQFSRDIIRFDVPPMAKATNDASSTGYESAVPAAVERHTYT